MGFTEILVTHRKTYFTYILSMAKAVIMSGHNRSQNIVNELINFEYLLLRILCEVVNRIVNRFYLFYVYF